MLLHVDSDLPPQEIPNHRIDAEGSVCNASIFRVPFSGMLSGITDNDGGEQASSPHLYTDSREAPESTKASVSRSAAMVTHSGLMAEIVSVPPWKGTCSMGSTG